MPRNYSQLDPNQMASKIFDEENEANRVVIVGQKLEVDSGAISEAVYNALKGSIEGLKPAQVSSPMEVRIVDPKPMERVIERPVVVEKVVVQYVDKPIPVVEKEIQVVQVEKPVVVEKVVEKLVPQAESPKSVDITLKVLFGIQALATLLIAISLFIKK